MEVTLKALINRLYGVRVEVEPVSQFTTITTSKKDALQLEFESLGVQMFTSKVKSLKMSYSQVLNGIIAIKRVQQQYALDFFKSGAQFAMDSFIASTTIADKIMSIKMRVLCFLFINKNITIGEHNSKSYLHSECKSSLDSLMSSQEVQRAIKSEVESSKGMFSFSSNSFKSSGGRVLVEVSSLIHWVEQLTQLNYQIPSLNGSNIQAVSLSSVQTKMKGHRNRVTSIATSSQFVFSGAKDNQIKVWDINTLALKATLKGHSSPISCLAVVDNILFSGSGDGTVRSWDIRTMRPLAVSRGVSSVFDYSVRSLAVDKKSGNVFAGCSDGVIRVMDASSLQSKGAMKGHKQWVTSLAVSDNLLFSGSLDCSIKVWDMQSFMCINALSGHSSFIISLVVAGGRLFSGSHDKSVKIWDIATLKQVAITSAQQHDSEVRSLTVSNNKVYVGYADDRINVLDARSLETVGRVQAKETSFDNCLAVADGKMFVGSAGKTIQVQLL